MSNSINIMGLQQLSSFSGTNVSNACVFLYINKTMFFSIESSGKYGFIGGGRKKNETPWTAMKREFQEETGQTLPRLRNLLKFLWNGHTAIYVGEINTKLDLTCKNGDGELLGIKMMRRNEILQAIRCNKIRNSGKNSIPQLIRHLQHLSII